MHRPDVVAEEPLFLDEPEAFAPPPAPAAPPLDELFPDENAPAVHRTALPSAATAALPAAWRARRGAGAARADRVRVPLLISLIALGLLIGFTVVTFLR